MKRQQRKLNFLITQTELYAHFMARKLTGATDAERDAILQHFDEPVSMKPHSVIGGVVRTVLDDDYGMLLLPPSWQKFTVPASASSWRQETGEPVSQ